MKKTMVLLLTMLIFIPYYASAELTTGSLSPVIFSLLLKPDIVTYTVEITNRSIDQTVNYINATGENATVVIAKDSTMTLVVQENSALEATIFNPNGPTGSLMIDGDLQSGCTPPPGPARITVSLDAILMITDC